MLIPLFDLFSFYFTLYYARPLFSFPRTYLYYAVRALRKGGMFRLSLCVLLWSYPFSVAMNCTYGSLSRCKCNTCTILNIFIQELCLSFYKICINVHLRLCTAILEKFTRRTTTIWIYLVHFTNNHLKSDQYITINCLEQRYQLTNNEKN